MTTVVVTMNDVELGRVTLPPSADAVLEALVARTVILELDRAVLAKVLIGAELTK